ncbi:MAG: PspC domain-containing protein [Candidatus Methanofastidiosia archaeon]
MKIMDNKKLYRSRKNKVLGGVAGGLAEYFNIDPTLIRLLWIVFIFAAGGGVLAYIVCWIIIPEEPQNSTTTQEKEKKTKQKDSTEDRIVHPASISIGNIIIGVLIALFGVAFLLRNLGVCFFHKYWFSFSDVETLWPLLLVAIGILIIYKNIKR